MMQFLTGDEKRFSEFIGNLQEKDKIAILTHTDPDGICSAVIASKVLGKIDYLEFVHHKRGIYSEIAQEMKKKKINKIFITDFSFDKEVLMRIEKFAEVVIIDHHPLKADFNSGRTIYLKADSEYPASYISYYLFSKIQKVPSWIAALGILGDCSYKYSEKTCIRVFEDYGLDEPKNLWNEMNNLDLALIYFRGREEKIYNLLMGAKTPEDLKIAKYAQIISREVEKKLEEFEREKEEHNGLIVYSFKAKYPIKSPVINKISMDNLDKTVVVIQDCKKEDYLNISARCQGGRIKCPFLLKEAIKDIPDSTGDGHFKAAGGRIPRDYLSKFKENLIGAYDELIEK